MKKIRLFSVLILSLILMSLTVYAEIPDRTVIIGSNAYDINYVNEEQNYGEILNSIINSNNVYVKWNNIWYDDIKGEVISKELIGQVKYKNMNGEITEYAAFDGEEIKFTIKKVQFISDRQIKIEFSNIINGITASNGELYKINGETLSEEDQLLITDEGKAIIIKLKNKIPQECNEYKIQVSKEIVDTNNDSLVNDYEEDILVINKENFIYSNKESIHTDINVTAKNVTLENIKVYSDIYVNNDGVLINNIEGNSRLYLNPGETASSYLTDSVFNQITILSGGKNSIHLKNINANTLKVDGNILKQVRVDIKGNSKIKKSEIKTDSIIEMSDEAEIEMLGVAPINDKSKIKFKGTFDNITINSQAEFILDATVHSLTSNCNAKIKLVDGSKIEKKNDNDFKLEIVDADEIQNIVISDDNDDIIIPPDTTEPFIQNAYVTLNDESILPITFFDNYTGEIDLSGIGDVKMADFTIELSENNCYVNMLIPTNTINVRFKRKIDNNIVSISEQTDIISEYDKGEKGVSLYKLRQITEGDKMKITATIEDTSGNKANIAVDLIVRK